MINKNKKLLTYLLTIVNN